METISLVIIDESAPFIDEVVEIVKGSAIEVVGTATKKEEMMSIITQSTPHVVLLDISMFTKDENAELYRLLTTIEVPVIMISDSSVQQTAKTVYAITNGANDFILRDQLNHKWYQADLIKKIKSVSNTQNIKENLTDKKDETARILEKTNEHSRRNSGGKTGLVNTIIAIGTSTGGPRALQKVLQTFPKDFRAPILIIQHMPSGFTKSLANRLNDHCSIHVKEAVHGERIHNGVAYIAPGDYHMTVKEEHNQFTITITQEKERLGHRPSVNTLLDSIAKLDGLSKIVVILTGMGKDGADGVERMKQMDNDTYIIVESEATAVIHGMPSAVIQTGTVNEIVHLDDIGLKVLRYIQRRGK